MKNLIVFLLCTTTLFSQGDHVIDVYGGSFEIVMHPDQGPFFEPQITIDQSGNHFGQVIIQRLKAEDKEGIRFAWQSIHGQDYGRVQVDKVVPSSFVPDKHTFSQDILLQVYAEFPTAFTNYVPASQAFKEGGKAARGHYRYLDYEWCYDVWTYKGREYSIAAALRDDGQFWISYAVYFKK